MNNIWTKLRMISLGFILALAAASFGFASGANAQSACDSTYTVRAGNMLWRIARQCDTTVDALLNANPDITNRNLIRVGQVIQIPAASMQPPEDSEGNSNGSPEDNPEDDAPVIEPQVSIVPSSGAPGTEIDVRVAGFPAEQEVALGIGVEDAPLLDSMTATTDAEGRLLTSITLPATAQVGERWIITVQDTSPGGVEITSSAFLVGTGEENVSISPMSGPAGTEIQVDAGGFPANVPVHVGIGLYASEPVTTELAQSDAQGSVSTSILLPDDAEPRSEWAVVVGTEDWRISVNSGIFEVTDEVANGEPDEDFVLHTVQRGEWLHRIARQYETTVPAILAMNPDIANPNQIRVGQQIRIPAPTDAPVFTQVDIFLIALNDGGQRGPEIGCNDSAVAVQVEIEPTVAPLQAALERLLEVDGSEYDLNNVFAGSDLAVEDVNIRNGEAIIYLAGQLGIGGVCDHPRIEEQLERTALQFDTVDSVLIFVNDEPLSEILNLQ